MCGRYALTLPPEAIRKLFGYAEQPNFPPRFNIAPTQPIAIVREARDGLGNVTRHFVLVRWGLWPPFVKDPKTFPLLFNARGEELADKPSFRLALRRRRCLIPADGFYEWRKASAARAPAQPMLIRRGDRQPFGFGGLWETWTGPNGEEVETACIITTEASGLLAAIHPRMPVVIPPAAFDQWLDPRLEDGPELLRLLQADADPCLEAVAIGPAINKALNDWPDVQEPAQQAEPLPAIVARDRQGSFAF